MKTSKNKFFDSDQKSEIFDIRKARKEDIRELVKLVKDEPAIEDYPGEYSAKVFEQMLKDKETIVFAVEEDKKIIAFQEFKLDKAQKRIYLHTIVVAKKHRGKGIGKLLMKEIEKFARKNNYKRLSFIVRDWNKAMNMLAEKIGYKQNSKLILWEKKLG